MMHSCKAPTMNVVRTSLRSVQCVWRICQRGTLKTAAYLQQPSAFAAATTPAAQPTGYSSGFASLSQRPRFVVACQATDSMESSVVELEVKVEGMKCGGCSSRVEEALKAMEHVKGVQVDLETKLATVEVEAENLIDAMNMLPKFVDTIKELGFEAEPHIEYQL